MRTLLVPTTAAPIVECADAVVTADQAADLVAACIENGARGALIDAARLPDDFFDLSSRFAGEFVQTFVNYQIRLAVVFPSDLQCSERFREFAREARNGQRFRIVDSRTEAEAWLASP